MATKRVINASTGQVSVVPTTPADDAQRAIDEAAHAAKVAADIVEKGQRKGRKQGVLAKLGLNKNDIQALAELVQDGNDD